MATLTDHKYDRAGLNITDVAEANASAGGDEFANDGRQLFYIRNGGAGAITVNFAYGSLIDGQTVPAKSVSVGIGKTMVIGSFPTSLFNDANGKVQVTYSGVTSVRVACIRKADNA